jgi:hypothetical protein
MATHSSQRCCTPAPVHLPAADAIGSIVSLPLVVVFWLIVVAGLNSCSILLAACRDEFHSRLKFSHRGLVACANQASQPRQLHDVLPAPSVLFKAGMARLTWAACVRLPGAEQAQHQRQPVLCHPGPRRPLQQAVHHLWQDHRHAQAALVVFFTAEHLVCCCLG